MRISDWSSDVCSSDLTGCAGGGWRASCAAKPAMSAAHCCDDTGSRVGTAPGVAAVLPPGPGLAQPSSREASRRRARWPDRIDRKSVVEGKSVSVRVDLGGRRILKKKTDP